MSFSKRFANYQMPNEVLETKSSNQPGTYSHPVRRTSLHAPGVVAQHIESTDETTFSVEISRPLIQKIHPVFKKIRLAEEKALRIAELSIHFPDSLDENGRTTIFDVIKLGSITLCHYYMHQCQLITPTTTVNELVEHINHSFKFALYCFDRRHDYDIDGDAARKKLISHVTRNTINIVRKLLNSVNVNHQDINGCTALMEAASVGNLDVVKLLVEEGKAKLNLEDNYGNNALFYAAVYGHHEIIEYLSLKGINTFKLNNTEKLAAIYTTFPGSLNCLNILSYTVDNRSKNSIATIAAKNGQLEFLKQYLSADSILPNVIDQHSESNVENIVEKSFLHATIFGSMKSVKYLLENCEISIITIKQSINKSIIITDVQTPYGPEKLEKPTINEQCDVVISLLGVLKSHGETFNPSLLLLNSLTSQKEKLSLHLLENYNINTELKLEEKNITMLMIAASYCNIDLMKRLIEKGANVSTRDISGRDAVYYVIRPNADNQNIAQNIKVEAIKLLSANGANLNTNLPTALTPLELAIKYKLLDIAEALVLQLGVNPKNSKKALPLAIESKNCDLLEFICHHGAGCDYRNPHTGSTCLHSLATETLTEISIRQINIILSHYPKLINSRTLLCVTPLMYASYNNNDQMVRFLCTFPCIELNARDQRLYTAAMYAQSQGNILSQNILAEYGSQVSFTDRVIMSSTETVRRAIDRVRGL